MPQPDTRPARDATEPRRDAQRERPRGVLVPFPAPGARRPRRAPRAGEARGEILLFLGVRYERRAS
ncbi:hypothetical protein Q8W71_26720 [Methylobacterium sp. NEAU 140]|uniref:hypothetical protein n=1 Tax=Methylobacterium sp. NEAU 140 TaxID=3064945 RepID=UPI0027356F73|nr:hypothetical protein [Methylobacterium sp. NEAU 140]MDP4026225.1 hypothetical protein [Methylobacterium sp. NEAU 140]